jgi:anti-anti-sigma factor
MQTQEESLGDVTVLTISGHLDTSSATGFETLLMEVIDRGERKVLVDCGPLEYVNSAGLKVFLLAAKKLESGEGQLVLCSLSASVLMIFEMIGFTRIMSIAASREEGLRMLREQGAKA